MKSLESVTKMSTEERDQLLSTLDPRRRAALNDLLDSFAKTLKEREQAAEKSFQNVAREAEYLALQVREAKMLAAKKMSTIEEAGARASKAAEDARQATTEAREFTSRLQQLETQKNTTAASATSTKKNNNSSDDNQQQQATNATTTKENQEQQKRTKNKKMLYNTSKFSQDIHCPKCQMLFDDNSGAPSSALNSLRLPVKLVPCSHTVCRPLS